MKPTQPSLLELRISLSGIKPIVWRRIALPNTSTFFELHVAIQDAFEWTDLHLHQFFTASPFQRMNLYKRIGFPMGDGMDDDLLDERTILLSKYLRTQGDELWYEYDFGDSWMHKITVNHTVQPIPNEKYPRLLDGAGSVPPEDSGGIGGYEHLLEVLKNPKNPEHNDMLEWLSIEKAEEFELPVFDPKNITFRDPKQALKEFEKQLPEFQ